MSADNLDSGARQAPCFCTCNSLGPRRDELTGSIRTHLHCVGHAAGEQKREEPRNLRAHFGKGRKQDKRSHSRYPHRRHRRLRAMASKNHCRALAPCRLRQDKLRKTLTRGFRNLVFLLPPRECDPRPLSERVPKLLCVTSTEIRLVLVGWCHGSEAKNGIAVKAANEDFGFFQALVLARGSARRGLLKRSLQSPLRRDESSGIAPQPEQDKQGRHENVSQGKAEVCACLQQFTHLFCQCDMRKETELFCCAKLSLEFVDMLRGVHIFPSHPPQSCVQPQDEARSPTNPGHLDVVQAQSPPPCAPPSPLMRAWETAKEDLSKLVSIGLGTLPSREAPTAARTFFLARSEMLPTRRQNATGAQRGKQLSTGLKQLRPDPVTAYEMLGWEF